MTSPGKNVYIISILDSQSRMQSYTIAATTMALAQAEACTLAGVEAGTEVQTSQKSGRIDAEAA